MEIGTKKQLFIDDLVIDEVHGVTRNLNQPAKYVGNPIMIPLHPWEEALSCMALSGGNQMVCFECATRVFIALNREGIGGMDDHFNVCSGVW